MRGQIFFSWIDEDETFDTVTHARMDEDVFSLTLSQEEGDFGALSLEIKNPRIGLLNAARKIWCFLAIDTGLAIVPIFKGRLLGVPTNVFDTLVTIEFTARPSDYATQKAALAESLKVLPYYDPIFVSPDSWGDPDVVLEGYSRLWHVDPVTHVLTTSDVLVPEDGVELITAEQHFYDSMEVTLNQTPLRTVQMVATIPWTQSGNGFVTLDRRITELLPAGSQGIIKSFTMQGLISDWPKVGADFGSGWKVSQSTIIDTTTWGDEVTIPDIFSYQGEVPFVSEGSVVYPLVVTGEYHSGEKAGINFQYELLIAILGYAVGGISVSYTAGREYAQVVTFTLRTDQQAIVTMPGDDEALLLTLNANKVSEMTEGGQVPIGDLRRPGYVHTARGKQSIQHLLLVARAHLCARSRAVETAVTMPFIDALRLRSLRKGAIVQDPRLPGGEAAGKVIGYTFTLDGTSGTAQAVIRVGSAVGYGGSHTVDEGTPDYADDDWDVSYQTRSGEIELTDTEDIAFSLPSFSTFDDGLPLMKGLNEYNAVLELGMVNNHLFQEGEIADLRDQQEVSTALQNCPTQFSFKMIPMEGGPFQQEVVISVSDLIVPKQIDLEAPSNA